MLRVAFRRSGHTNESQRALLSQSGAHVATAGRVTEGTGLMITERESRQGRHIEARERERVAMELRKAGATYQQIGAQMGVSEVTAYRVIRRAVERLNKLVGDEATGMRRLELERLDQIMLSIWPHVKRGNLQAIDRALKCMERRSRYLGLDQPVKIEGDLTHYHGDDIDQQLRAIAQELRSSKEIPVTLGDAGGTPGEGTRAGDLETVDASGELANVADSDGPGMGQD